MDKVSISEKQLYFKEPRLIMNVVSRLVIRIFIFVFYIGLGVIAWILGSSTNNAKYLGILLAIFLVDRLVHMQEPKKKFNDSFKKGIKEGKNFN